MADSFQYRQEDKEGGTSRKKRFNTQYFCWGMTAFLVVVGGICFYYLMFHGANIKAGLKAVINIMMPIVFGFGLAYLLTPILNYVEYRLLFPACEKLKIKESRKRNSVVRGIGILITAVLFFALIYSLCAMMLSQIVPSIMNIVNNFDTYINNMTNWLDRILTDNPELSDYVTRLLDRYSEELERFLNETVFSTTSELIKVVSLSVISVLGILWDFIIGFVISIYVLASKEKFAGQAKKMAYAFLDTQTANVVISNFRFTHKTFIGFISGKVLDSIIIGLLCFIGTTLLNTPYAALISVVVGITNIIPFFGPYLGAIPSIILIFVVDPLHPLNCVYFALFILALQQFDGNVLGPKILGDSTGLTGFWVIFAITFFGGLFGVLGMIVGVPILAVIYSAVKSLVNIRLRKRSMPEDTENYMDVGSVDAEGIFHEFIPEHRMQQEQKRYSRKNDGDKSSDTDDHAEDK